jgi:hypothetical protein
MTMAAALLTGLQLAVPASADTVTGGRIRVAAIALAGPTVLEAGRTLVPLRRTRNPLPGRPAFAMVTIEGLVFDAPPGVMYEVYLQAANGRRALLGVIDFYNRTAPGYGGAGAVGRAAMVSPSFDATDAIRTLGGNAAALVFEPTSGVTGPAVRANPRARLRFASATISAR